MDHYCNNYLERVVHRRQKYDHEDLPFLFQLLDHEVHAKDQVPLLIEMKKADVALDKAIESGDPQLGKKTQ